MFGRLALEFANVRAGTRVLMLLLLQAQALMKSIKGVQDALAIWMFPMDRERCETHGQTCWRVYRAEAERVDEGQLHVYGETARRCQLPRLNCHVPAAEKQQSLVLSNRCNRHHSDEFRLGSVSSTVPEYSLSVFRLLQDYHMLCFSC